jgi:hypothetical protein
LPYQHDDRCSNEYIKQSEHYSHIFSGLDVITLLLRIRSREATSDHIEKLEELLSALRDGWEVAHISYTPKCHSLSMHAVPQRKIIGVKVIFGG